ncbi:hypothetical protein TYRP_012382 [Tyrophagus putrescentiae]|nr:hypothetical protein TYRP_012382 [Tyrophagus putrescentiae]
MNDCVLDHHREDYSEGRAQRHQSSSKNKNAAHSLTVDRTCGAESSIFDFELKHIAPCLSEEDSIRVGEGCGGASNGLAAVENSKSRIDRRASSTVLLPVRLSAG